MPIDLFYEVPNLGMSTSEVAIVSQVNLFFLDSAHDTLNVAILPGRTDFGHADFYLSGFKLGPVGIGCILTPWSL